ncbi:hypothetical protein AFE_1252 [Acidithiobacillus ferrooxidans ATCC 23270]|uniref:Uncharacterized protein n=1 Tax=Acidithiobacillus ferrooxidans (strain ATCC 23270 / DSM 14882 / CIP 104768 / NCIMB 8455) TaxID=243159 RepID=B7J8T5_ACIF2|nr:hypothetical protein AFE_1252 [Acidithiobacillus ferrooxidans ATCC 23270]
MRSCDHLENPGQGTVGVAGDTRVQRLHAHPFSPLDSREQAMQIFRSNANPVSVLTRAFFQNGKIGILSGKPDIATVRICPALSLVGNEEKTVQKPPRVPGDEAILEQRNGDMRLRRFVWAGIPHLGHHPKGAGFDVLDGLRHPCLATIFRIHAYYLHKRIHDRWSMRPSGRTGLCPTQ